MKKLIFNAIAVNREYAPSSQLTTKDMSGISEVYLKNSFVSLMSAVIHNPDADTCLFTNFEVPGRFRQLFESNGIQVKTILFDCFYLPGEYEWAPAFFKLAALRHALNTMDYDLYMLLDTDTYTVAPFTDIWEECRHGILLFDVDHRVSHPHRRAIIDNLRLLYWECGEPIHYGGEFISGSRDKLCGFIKKCEELYYRMLDRLDSIDRSMGDEFLLAGAADIMKADIIRANCYIYRYWTGFGFYLVSTNHAWNSVDIWHVPVEKERGMLKLYRYFLKKGRFPCKGRSAKMLKLPASRRLPGMMDVAVWIKKHHHYLSRLILYK